MEKSTRKSIHSARVCAFHSFDVRAKHTYRLFGGRTVAPLYERQRCRHGYYLAHCNGYSFRARLRYQGIELDSHPTERGNGIEESGRLCAQISYRRLTMRLTVA